MSNQSLHGKTIRPGSLSGYSYYYSNRRPVSRAQAAPKRRKLRLSPLALKLGGTAAVVLALLVVPMLRSDPGTVANQANTVSGSNLAAAQKPAASAPAAAVQPTVNQCEGNTIDKWVKIDVSERHLWACEGGKLVHDTPVITGMLRYPETLTPPGTYKIYGKMQDTRLTGADSAGSWNYPVSYWMPFLDNEHGTYGFHDATWRPDSDFGNTDPNGDKASHGCIELVLGSAKWLYEWAPVGTTLTVES